MKYFKRLFAVTSALLLVPTLALCQEDINEIRKQMRKAKLEASAQNEEDKEDYKKLIAEEQRLLEKLEKKGTSVSVTRELPTAEEEDAGEDFKASINHQNTGSSATAGANNEFGELEEKLQSLRSKYEGANEDYSKMKASNNSLQKRLNVSEANVVKLNKELQKARTRLLVAETEVERLSAVLEERRKVAAKQPKPKKINAEASRIGSQVSIDKGPNRVKYVDDMPIATVVVKKANIRTGPGVNNSPLMTVSRGTRLAVETRKGDWYRIIAPTGVRAWVNSQVVAFGEDSKSSPGLAVKVKGYNGEAANEG